MIGFEDLYRFTTDPDYTTWRAQGTGTILARIVEVLLYRAAQLPLDVPLPLLVLGALGAFMAGRTLPFSFVILLTWFVPAVTAPVPARNPARFVAASIAILCVLASLALRHLIARWRQRRLIVAIAGLAFVLGGSAWFWPAQVRNPLARGTWMSQYTPIPDYLQPAGRPALESGDIVLTTDPWQVGAVLGVATVMIPIDSPEAVREVAARYHPRYFLLPNETLWWKVASRQGPTDVMQGLSLRKIRETRDGKWYELSGTSHTSR